MKQEIIEFLNNTKYFGLRKIYYSLKQLKSEITVFLTDSSVIKRERQQSLVKYKISKILIEEFDGDFGHNINTEQFFLGFGLVHYALVRNCKPKHILCVGSRKGYIPAILALACKDNGSGHIDFVDAGYDQDKPTKHWSGVGFWKKNNPNKHFGKIGISNFITTYVMTTQEYAKKYPKKRYQYIYIDGDHSYESVKKDYSFFWPGLDKKGFMSFHDVIAKGYLDKGLFGVWKLWEELKENKIVFPFPKDSGLGIIQKV